LNENACFFILPVIPWGHALVRKSEGNAARAATIHRLVSHRVSAGAAEGGFQVSDAVLSKKWLLKGRAELRLNLTAVESLQSKE